MISLDLQKHIVTEFSILSNALDNQATVITMTNKYLSEMFKSIPEQLFEDHNISLTFIDKLDDEGEPNIDACLINTTGSVQAPCIISIQYIIARLTEESRNEFADSYRKAIA